MASNSSYQLLTGDELARDRASGPALDSQGAEAKAEEDNNNNNTNHDDMAMNRPPMHRPTEGRSQQPLLKHERRGRLSDSTPGGLEGRPMLPHQSRRSVIRSRSPEYKAEHATRRKYLIASGFLVLSLISFVVQTETAAYIQHDLGWAKPYCML